MLVFAVGRWCCQEKFSKCLTAKWRRFTIGRPRNRLFQLRVSQISNFNFIIKVIPPVKHKKAMLLSQSSSFRKKEFVQMIKKHSHDPYFGEVWEYSWPEKVTDCLLFVVNYIYFLEMDTCGIIKFKTDTTWGERRYSHVECIPSVYSFIFIRLEIHGCSLKLPCISQG